jgi:hypothetical protein
MAAAQQANQGEERNKIWFLSTLMMPTERMIDPVAQMRTDIYHSVFRE